MEYIFAICDDDFNHLDVLKYEIIKVSKEYNLKIEIYKYDLGIQLIDELLIDPNKYDIIFLDIEMPEMDGMKVGRRIREINKNVIIIFVTGFKAFALNAFEIRASDYLIKPVKYIKLEATIIDAIDKVNLYKIKGQDSNTLTLSFDKKIYRINANEIIFIEKESNKSRIVCEDNIYEIYESLKKLNQRLDKKAFIQPHQGFIIHSKKIKNYENQKIEMISGDIIPVSKSNIKKVKNIFFESLRD